MNPNRSDTAPRSPVARLRSLPPWLGLVAVLLLTAQAACDGDTKPPAVLIEKPKLTPQGMVTLHFDTLPASDEMVVLRIKAGPLPRGARILATTPEGTPVASIRPYGPNDPAGTSYTFIVPTELLKDRSLQFKLSVLESAGKPARLPTATEVLQISAFYSK